jgi:tetratricopeptide (TPR) repeat protein
MLSRFVFLLALLLSFSSAAGAGRVALIIGQNEYRGRSPAEAGLPPLDNPARDARALAALLRRHGFEVISCDGKEPGCFDVSRASFLKALTRLEERARAADLALVFFAGHGVATEEGNILAPTDAGVNCETGAVTLGVPVERIMAAAAPARDKLLILDACRDNPIGDICPALKGRKLSFTRIEAGAMQRLLLVTSTQFGQQARDGLPGAHSPFLSALLAALQANPNVYFEQVMNEVARETYDKVQAQWPGFLQIPGKVVGGAAPADCLAGKDCFGDPRMASLAAENDRLSEEAAGVRNLLAAEETARGTPYTADERRQRVAQLQATLQSIGGSADPVRQEGRRLIEIGNVPGGTAKLDEALEADEKAMAEAERIAVERRKAAAQGARDLAVLAQGRDAVKAMSYYERATVLNPEDAANWHDYAVAAMEVGRLAEAKTAFERAVILADDASDFEELYSATIGLGDVAKAEGSLADARRAYDVAFAIAQRQAKADPDNTDWQRDLSVSHEKMGDVLVAQGNLLEALAVHRAALAIADRLAKADPGNAEWQRDLSVSHERIGDVWAAQGNRLEALAAYRASLAIRDRLAKTDPGNAEWQRDLSISQGKIGDMLVAQGDLPEALVAHRAALAIADRLAKADPGNAGWQRDLSISHDRIGGVLLTQGNLLEALAVYRASLAIRERLTQADPGNAGWQHDLSVSQDTIGDVLVAQGQRPEALTAYQASLAIRDRLAKTDPDNAGWQRDLSVSHERIGDMLTAQGNPLKALVAYKASLAIRDRLAKTDPGNAEWQRDLSVSQDRIGNVLVAQSNLPEALTAYQASLAIRDRLAKADPDNAEWQRNLAVSHGKMGGILAQQGKTKRAEQTFREGRAIIEKLRSLSPDNATLPRDLAWFDAQLARVRE